MTWWEGSAHIILEARHIREVGRLADVVLQQLQHEVRQRGRPCAVIGGSGRDTEVGHRNGPLKYPVQLVPDLEPWRICYQAGRVLKRLQRGRAAAGCMPIVRLQARRPGAHEAWPDMHACTEGGHFEGPHEDMVHPALGLDP